LFADGLSLILTRRATVDPSERNVTVGLAGEGTVHRNLMLLLLCQAIVTAGTVLVITVGGIIGVTLAPAPWLATLPPSLMVVGTALAVMPATQLSRRLGRRRALTVAAFASALGPLLAALALSINSFWLFCGATSLFGFQLAFAQQYRFAAAESVDESAAARAIAFVLMGSIGGAFAGPAIASNLAAPIADVPWLGAFLLVACLDGIAGLLLFGLRLEEITIAPGLSAAGRSVIQLLASPRFLIAMLAGVVGQGMMAFVMTATPVSMHVIDGHDLASTTAVIRAHVLGMYLPSLISAVLIGWLGVRLLMWIGVIALAATIAVGLQGHAWLHYWWALVLLGVGWNFLFVGGTSLLVTSYAPEERFRAQSLNDFTVFSCSALASLLAGSVVTQIGWNAVLWGASPFLALIACALAWLAVLDRRSDQPIGQVSG
jgi:predicted MFS family arabinose efflux permease